MGNERFSKYDLRQVETPCFIVDMDVIEDNLKILGSVQKRTGAVILLALKGFATFSTFPIIKKYLSGICASGFHEAKLGAQEFKKQVHVFSPAYSQKDMKEILKYADYLIFNSFAQWEKYKAQIQEHNKKRKKQNKKTITCGLRINPEYSEVKVQLYNPCARGSRLGILVEDFEGKSLEGISGLHFHVMCEQGADTLQRVLEVVEKKFGKYIKNMEWINFGGGHHITKQGYDLNLLCNLITNFKKKYNNMQVYLEPGEAIALNAGVSVSSVLDIVDHHGTKVGILDTSAETHMPDVLAMPYRPEVIGADLPGKKKYTYRFGGPTCLGGDVIGDYSFDKPLSVGDKLVFLDMAIYSMVKTTTFNGMKLPDIALAEKGKIKLVRRFGYEEYKRRLS